MKPATVGEATLNSDARPLPDDVSPLTEDDPTTLGPYRLLGRLGAGGMGTVYLAVRERPDSDTDAGDRAAGGGTAADRPAADRPAADRPAGGGGRPGRSLVAAKVVHPELAYDEHFRARFGAEVRLASRVASFATAPVLDYGEVDGRPYLITEYIAGMPLDRMTRRDGPLSASGVHAVAFGIAAALASIHNAGLVHRDLKPSNVILSLSGTRVIDFGIARALDTPSRLTRSGVTMGSPGWMAPEQILGKPVTPAADVFAWACLVVYAATGRHPFGAGDPIAVAYRTLNESPVLEGVPAPLHRLVSAALEEHPEDRPSARELLTWLTESTAQGFDQPDDPDAVTQISLLADPAPDGDRRWRGTSVWPTAAAITLFATLGALLALVLANPLTGDGPASDAGIGSGGQQAHRHGGDAAEPTPAPARRDGPGVARDRDVTGPSAPAVSSSSPTTSPTTGRTASPSPSAEFGAGPTTPPSGSFRLPLAGPGPDRGAPHRPR